MGLLCCELKLLLFVCNLLVVFIFVVVIGLVFYKYIEVLLGNVEVVVIVLIVGGFVIFVVEWFVLCGDISGVVDILFGKVIGIGFL